MSADLQKQYNGYKANLEVLNEKIAQLDDDAEQHRNVLQLLKNMDGDRKCMRMIGSVLVEQTVNEASPRLQETLTGLERAISELNKDLEKQSKEMEEWKVKNKVKVVSS